MEQTTFDRVKKQIVELTVCDDEEVKPESTLGDLGCDSLDVVEIVMALEDEFKIEIPDTDDNVDEITVQKIVDKVDELVKAKA
jgi:acyl carrier protein